jgi:hypothetical protein
MGGVAKRRREHLHEVGARRRERVLGGQRASMFSSGTKPSGSLSFGDLK